MRMDVEPLPGSPLLIDLAFTALPGLRIVSGVVGPTRNARTADLIDPSHDDHSFSLVEGGGRLTLSRGREVITQSGEAQLMAPGDPFLTTTTTATRILRLQAPRAALAGVIGDLDDLALRPIPGDSQPLRLLKGYVGSLGAMDALESPELRQAVVAHVHDLMVLTLGAHRDRAEMAGGRGLAAARLAAIKGDIARHLTGDDVGVEAVAARQGVSSRQVQRLFEAEGTTFSAHVADRRLGLAHQMLRDPGLADRTIASIAFDCGFGDLSHFNRAFRRRFAATPSDIRWAARARRCPPP
jgi:AraC-like DNA-binding protein